MKARVLLSVLVTIALLPAALPLSLRGAEDEAAKRVQESATVLNEIMAAPDGGIPQDLMQKAACVVVIPGLKKGGFIVGGQYGVGVISCRQPNGSWSGPSTVRAEGGSIGFQIGGAESDVILLVMNERGAEKLMQSKFTIGGDATAAAGPVGRNAKASTDAQMHAEILSYSRSRGVFAGIALEGATLRPDNDANRQLYGHDVEPKDILSGKVPAPAAAQPMLQALSTFGKPSSEQGLH